MKLVPLFLGMVTFVSTLSGGLLAARYSGNLGRLAAFSAGVISHDFADGIDTVTVMLNSLTSLRSSVQMLLLDATTPLPGLISTLFITIRDHYKVHAGPARCRWRKRCPSRANA